MKPLFAAALITTLGVGPALAETTATPDAVPENVCLRTADIDRTTTPDDKTILFHMKNGKVWRSALVSNCPLLSARGFSYSPTESDKICGNMQSIKVIGSGSVCLLGPLTQETPVGDH